MNLVGERVDASRSSGSAERGRDSGSRQLCAGGWCRCDRQDGPGFRLGQIGGGLAGERLEECRVVLAQDRAQFVGGLCPAPDGVLVRPGEHRDRLCELTVGRQLAVLVHIGAQDVGQRHRVRVVGLGPTDRVPLAVVRHRQWVDRKHRSAGGPQCCDQQPSGRFDRHRDRRLLTIARLLQDG